MKTECLVLGLLHTNCYLIYDEGTKDAVIIDPATSYIKIQNKINELELNPRYIILTHAHSDHIMALDAISGLYPEAKVCIGEHDAVALNDAELSLCSYFRNQPPTKKPDELLKDGQIINIANTSITVIHTPGHTCGSISLKYDDSLISGDTLFYESVGRTDFETSNSADLINSIKNRLFALPRETVVYPGHGEQTTIGHETDNNPFVW